MSLVSDGGRGCELAGIESQSYSYWVCVRATASQVLQRDVGAKWTSGGEVWSAAQLLFCLGRTASGQAQTHAYLGLYWTSARTD